jgi:hypothetical protein
MDEAIQFLQTVYAAHPSTVFGTQPHYNLVTTHPTYQAMMSAPINHYALNYAAGHPRQRRRKTKAHARKRSTKKSTSRKSTSAKKKTATKKATAPRLTPAMVTKIAKAAVAGKKAGCGTPKAPARRHRAPTKKPAMTKASITKIAKAAAKKSAPKPMTKTQINKMVRAAVKKEKR